MYSPKRKPGPKARKRDGEEGAAISASNPVSAEGEQYHSPSATDAAIPSTAVAPATVTPVAPTPAPNVTFSTATASVSATTPTASAFNSSAPIVAASTAAAPTAADVMQVRFSHVVTAVHYLSPLHLSSLRPRSSNKTPP